jgi:hypothetical protein
MVAGSNCTLISNVTFHPTYPLNSGSTPTTPSLTAIYLTTRRTTSSHTNTNFVSTFPVLLFILAQRSSRSLKKLLRRKKIIVSEPSLSNTSSSSNDQNMRDLETTNYSPSPPQIPWSTWNLRTHEQLSTNTSLETTYTSPPPSYQPRTPGTQTIGPSTNQFIGRPSLNRRNHSKSIGVMSSNALASTNPFHPHIYSPEDRVAIELIEYGREGLLQEHPAATDPVPVSPLERPLPETPSPSQLTAYSPNPSTSPYQTASASPVTEGEPHVVHPTLAV